MPTPERFAEQFEAHRPHVRAVAYRMLGSVSEAEDAVQEAWIRLSRTDVSAIENLRGWLTTVVARVCRLAFVLHDVFGMTFEEIAPIVDRSVVATRQLATPSGAAYRPRRLAPEESTRVRASGR